MNEMDIDRLMGEYESIAEVDLDLALRKMIELYFTCNEITHDVSDAIEIWVFEKGNESILEFITKFYSNYDERLLNIVKEGMRQRKL